MSDKATPRPWTVEMFGKHSRLHAPDVNTDLDLGGGIGDIWNNPANAELIVRSVNAHDQLVEALDRLAYVSVQLACNRPVRGLDEDIERARKALALARGEEVRS